MSVRPPDSRRWWAGEAPITFTWDLWYGCNYRCSYCWWEMDDLWKALAKQHRILEPFQWEEIWGRIHARYGEARIEVIGGEPIRYPGFPELARRLSAMHRLQVTTNLSLEPERLGRLLEELSPERVHFNASFHPQFVSLEDFLERANVLQRAGFEPGVLFVTWPPFLKRLAAYRAEFRERGFPFTPMIFQGRWEGKLYPEAFGAEEKALIADAMNPTVGKDAEVRYRLDRDSVFGKLCHSGRIYANIKGNGDVFRCGQDAFGRKPIGNIFDPEFRLFEEPKPCPYTTCSCLEFKYLDELSHERESAGC